MSLPIPSATRAGGIGGRDKPLSGTTKRFAMVVPDDTDTFGLIDGEAPIR
jgi:hypothetical protein